MNRPTSLIILLLLTGLISGQVYAQAVFTKIYRHRVQGQNIEWSGDKLIVAGNKHHLGHTDFAFIRMDTTGTIARAVGYHNTGFDRAAFIRNHPDGGYVLGGYSVFDPSKPDSSEIVLLRIGFNGAIKWARSYYRGNHKAGFMSGLEVNGDGTIVFTAHMHGQLGSSGSNLYGAVVQVDTSGLVMWNRALRLGNANITPNPLILDGPNKNLAIQNNGTILTGWNFYRFDSTTTTLQRGITIQALDNTGTLVWEEQYEARTLFSLALTPQDNGLALYINNKQGHKGMLKLDANGDLEWAREDAYQVAPNAAARVSLKPVANRIPFQVNQRISIEFNNPSALIRPSITSSTAHLRVRDFVTQGRRAYVLAHATTTAAVDFHSVLTKSRIDTVANCFFNFHPSTNYPSFTVDTLNVNLSSASVVLNSDSLILAQALLPNQDSIICVGNGLVWPGDANSDGVANVKDFLFVGLGWGKNGPPRVNPTIQWVGQTALNWNHNFFNGVNAKHADGNGNGHIGWFDILPIILNYGLTHNKGDINGNVNDPPLYLEMPQDSIEVGQKIDIPVFLGDSARSLANIYGVGFSIYYDPTLIDTNSIHFIPEVSWMGTDSVDLITMEKDFPVEGQLEVALTRITQTDASGYGKIGTLTFVTIDNISGKNLIAEKLKLQIMPRGAMNAEEHIIDIHGCPDSIIVVQETTTGIKDDLISEEITVYPNPVSHILQIDGGATITESLEIIDLLGRTAYSATLNKSYIQLDVGSLPTGVYTLKGKTREGYWTKKIIVE